MAERSQAMVCRRVVSRTWLGRLLTRVRGMEKERVVRLLAERGLITAEHCRFFALRRTFEDRS